MTTPNATHEVFNQSPPFENVDVFSTDRALVEAVTREGAGETLPDLQRYGAYAGSAEARTLGRNANENPPVLKTFDSRGNRFDVVDFHPAYHTLMQKSAEAGLHHLSSGPVPHVARSALLYLAAQMEAGHCCPMTMTNAAQFVLQRQPQTCAPWLEKIKVAAYDNSFLPVAQKKSVTIGMGMTEKQGGTDVRANTTRATPLGKRGAGQPYAITGHKWFMSAPMSDAFLVLAQAEGGLTCFLMPRFKPDGTVNALHFQRLKPKLGNRSNASSEVEFVETYAEAIGEEGEGTRHIIEMVTETRLDCAVSSAGLMRAALAEALFHCSHRTVFQKKLADQPLMQHVLASLVLEVEGAVALSFRLARAFDGNTAHDQVWRRVMTPVAKFWVCKMAPAFVAEAMECLGGNGYVEDGTLARIYREVPVNAIWEGSGNVMALDLVRILQKSPESARLVLDDLDDGARGEARLAAATQRLNDVLGDAANIERNARVLVIGLAELAAATLLRKHAPACVSDAFVSTHFGADSARGYGQGVTARQAADLLSRAMPAI